MLARLGVGALVISPTSPLFGQKELTSNLFSETNREHKEIPISNKHMPDQVFNWQRDGPIEFLDLLSAKARGGQLTQMVHCYHVLWIRETDIVKLVAKIDDYTPAASVVTPLESTAKKAMSTVSEQAAKLVEGFWLGVYPYNIIKPSTSVDSIKRWYSLWSQRATDR